MKHVLFFVGLLALSIQAYAQEFKLSGTVTENGVPLNEASVYVKDSGSGTLTNQKGNYTLNLEEGTYTIIFVFGNQKSKRVVIDSDKVLNVDLSGAEESLDEVFFQQ